MPPLPTAGVSLSQNHPKNPSLPRETPVPEATRNLSSILPAKSPLIRAQALSYFCASSQSGMLDPHAEKMPLILPSLLFQRSPPPGSPCRIHWPELYLFLAGQGPEWGPQREPSCLLPSAPAVLRQATCAWHFFTATGLRKPLLTKRQRERPPLHPQRDA